MCIIRKFIKAKNLKEAIKLEPQTDIHDCFIDNDWREQHLPEAIGFDDGIDKEDELE